MALPVHKPFRWLPNGYWERLFSHKYMCLCANLKTWGPGSVAGKKPRSYQCLHVVAPVANFSQGANIGRSPPPPPRVRPPGGVSHNPLKLPVAEGPGSIATCTCASCLRPPFRYTAQLATSHGGSPSHPLRPRPQLRAHCHFPPQGEPLWPRLQGACPPRSLQHRQAQHGWLSRAATATAAGSSQTGRSQAWVGSISCMFFFLQELTNYSLVNRRSNVQNFSRLPVSDLTPP